MPIPARRSSHRARVVIPALTGLALGTVFVASCSNATGPAAGGISVGVLSVAAPSYYTNAAGQPFITCDAKLEAHNTGSTSERWVNVVLTFLNPSDTANAFATETLDPGASWGSSSIGPDSAEIAEWHFTATAPFHLRMQFHVQSAGGAPDSGTTTLGCGPTGSSGPAPTITTLHVLGDTLLQPGDTLHVSYTATSTVGLWETALEISGPCDTTVSFADMLKPRASHDVRIPLPAACTLDSAVTVTAGALDVLYQYGSGRTTLPHLVDHTPPTVSAIVRSPYQDWEPIASTADYLFAGDSIGIEISAADNNAIRGAYWDLEPVGASDSLILTQVASGSWSASIPVQPSWPDTLQLRAYVRDVAGNVSDTASTTADGIVVYPTWATTANRTTVAGAIGDMVFDEPRGLLCVLQPNAHDIAIVSLASGVVTGTVPTPDYVPGFDLSPSGDSIITVLQNMAELGVVDLTQASPTLTTVALPGLDSAYNLLNVKVASNGEALIATQNIYSGVKRLYSYDLGTGTGRLRMDGPDLSDTASGAMARSDDGSTIVVNGFSNGFARYDAATDSFETPHTARVQNSDPVIDASGDAVIVAGDVYDASLQYVRTVQAPPADAEPTALSPDGQTYYAVIGPNWVQRGIVRSRVSDGTILDRIQLPTPISLIRASPDGTALAVVSNGLIAIVELSQLH